MDTLIIILMVLSPKDTTEIKSVLIEKIEPHKSQAAKRKNKTYYAKLEELYRQPKMR